MISLHPIAKRGPSSAGRLAGFSALLLSFVLLIPAQAEPRASTSYVIPTDTNDSGGRRATSTSYSNQGSVGGIVGISSVSTPSETAKHGYLGQITGANALFIDSSPLTLSEGATRQLRAIQLLDDLTTHAVPASSIAWSVQSGPLTGINTSGLATAGSVYQNTPAVAQGIHGGISGTLSLTVLDTLPDNFGSYAADGISDDWQVQHFGLSNPLAGPQQDPDHDGQVNLFEFTAGLIPTNPLSVFSFHIEAAPGFPSRKNLIFSPIVAGRTYTVKTAPTLGIPMSSLSGASSSDNANVRTVTDLSATGAAKFYSVQITKP